MTSIDVSEANHNEHVINNYLQIKMKTVWSILLIMFICKIILHECPQVQSTENYFIFSNFVLKYPHYDFAWSRF